MNRRKILSLLGMSPALLAASRADAQKKTKNAPPTKAKIEALNPKGTPPPIQLVPMAPLVGGQTNPYHMVANMRYVVSISIDKWT